MKKIVLASNNIGKVKEFQTLLTNCGFEVIPQSEFNVESVEETGLTFVENAILKARHASKISGLPALADDSGIEVDALKGAPGIYSARFSGVGASDKDNNDKLLSCLENTPSDARTARYQCVLALLDHAEDPTPILAHGAWEGTILRTPVGTGGFGYDPLFWVDSHNCSAAELSKAVKNSISHRAIAMQKLLAVLADVINAT